MTKLPPTQVYADLRQVGFSPAAAVTETAIAGAESGWDDTAVGDVRLENNTWGPSYGLFQVRTLKRQTGQGSDRDLSWLAASDLNQAKAAYDISHGGTNFSPWTTYTSGAFQRFLGPSQAAAGAAGTGTTPVGLFSGGAILGGVRNILVEAAAVGLGLGLVYVGAISVARPGADRAKQQLRGAVKAAL